MSAGIALVCGIHPLQVESVAWVAARNGLLCSVWMVAALCAYVRAVGSSPCRSGFVRTGGDGGNANRGWWWAAVALHVVALLTKPFAVSLPLLMLAADFFPLRRHQGRSVWRLVGEKWLMIVLSAAAAVVAIDGQEHVKARRSQADRGDQENLAANSDYPVLREDQDLRARYARRRLFAQRDVRGAGVAGAYSTAADPETRSQACCPACDPTERALRCNSLLS